MVGLAIGIIMGISGLYSIIKGKISFIKKYNGVKNIKLHSKIEGMAISQILIVLHYFMPIKIISLIFSLLLICIFTWILEIILKTI